MSIDNHIFYDNGVTYSHSSNSEVFIDVEYEQWGGHLNGYSTEETTMMIAKSDVIAMAKHFKLTADDLNDDG